MRYFSMLLATAALLSLTSCATSGPSPRRYFDYAEGASKAVVTDRADRRFELRRCLANWKGVEEARAKHLETMIGSDGRLAEGTLLVEIGNSDVARYDAIYVAGRTVKSSFSGAKTISPRLAALVRDVINVTTQDLLVGNATSSIDDGTCYFFAVTRSGTLHTAAMYGEPASTLLGQMLSELLLVVNAE